MFRLNNKLFKLNYFEFTYRYHAVTTTIVIVVQRWFYRNCLWLTSRRIAVYIILHPAALIFYLFPSWLSPLSPNLLSRNLYTNIARAWKQQLTEIVVLNVCTVVQAYIVNPIISPWPYLPDSWKKKKKLKRILCKEAIEYCCTCTLNIEYWQNIYTEHLKIFCEEF